METNPYQERYADSDHEQSLIAERDHDAPWYGYGSERAFSAASENEVSCQHCESHPCDCDRRRS